MKISKIASAFILGCLSIGIIGCGSSGGGGSSSSSGSITASDAYVVKLFTPATLTINGKEYNTTDVNNGKIIWNNLPAGVSLANAQIHVPADAVVDADGNGEYNASIDKPIKMALDTIGTGTVANPLGTAAIVSGDADAINTYKNFDPVEAKKRAILGESYTVGNQEFNSTQVKVLALTSDAIAFVAQQAGGDVSVLKDVNLSKDLNVSDTNVTSVVQNIIINVPGIDTNTIISKVSNVEKVINLAQEVVKTHEANLTDSITDTLLSTVLAVSDGGADPNTVTSVIQEINSSLAQGTEINLTQIETNLSQAIPATLELNLTKATVSFGGEHNVTLNGNTFTSIVNLSTEDTNITNYFDINLQNYTIAGGDINTTGSLSIKVVNSKGSATLVVSDINISKEGNNITTRFIANKTKVSIQANGLERLQNALGITPNTTYTRAITQDMTNNDLEFNIRSVLDNLAVNDNKINDALNVLNDYFNQPNEKYNLTVTMKFANTIINPGVINGTFFVTNVSPISLAVPTNGVFVNEEPNTAFEYNLTYTPADANVTCTLNPVISGLNVNCSNGTVTVSSNGLDEGEYNTTLEVTQNIDTFSYTKEVPITINVITNPIPSDAIELSINDNNSTVNNSDVTVSKVNGATLNGNLNVYFVPVAGNPSNSSATIVIKDSNGNAIATISPDDRYNNSTFYIVYNNQLKTVTYNKDAANGIIDVNF